MLPWTRRQRARGRGGGRVSTAGVFEYSSTHPRRRQPPRRVSYETYFASLNVLDWLGRDGTTGLSILQAGPSRRSYLDPYFADRWERR